MTSLLDNPVINLPPEAEAGTGNSTVQALSKPWSSFQLDVFNSVSNSSQNLLIQAVAGSGKTTTLVQSTQAAAGRSLFMAFNKSIAEEMRRRTPSDVKTLNALGHWQWSQNVRGARLDSKKTLTLLKDLMGDSEDFKEHGYQLSRVIGLAKNCAFGIDSRPSASAGSFERSSADVFPIAEEEWIDLIDSYGFDFPLEKQELFATLLAQVFMKSAQQKGVFDFDDQLWMPAHEGWDYPAYDTVFIDEGQDLSPIQHVMLERLAARGARLVIVGDRHQAIYGFRGALTNSMDLLKLKFQMKELPLSICYRCDNEIVHEARSYCPTIEPRPGAGAGVVIKDSASDPQLFSTELVVCRNNAPLFRAILRHYRAKSPCRVLSNFLESFKGFIGGFKSTYTSDLLAKLDIWYEKECEAAKRKRFKGRLAALEDKYETVKLLAAEFSRTEDLIRAVKSLGEGTSGPTFATIHKAKGLESPEVYILRPDLLPSKWAQTEEALQQEKNLSYVAITRAMKKLSFGKKEILT